MSKKTVAYMFAGVGSVRLAFEYDCQGFSPDKGWVWTKRESSPWDFAWTNQYEPPVRKDRNVQHAFDIYTHHFGGAGAINADIVTYLDNQDYYSVKVPDKIDLLVAGFPCQDFSNVNRNRKGIDGGKGQMWWQAYRMLSEHSPEMFIFENVDSLIYSPDRANKGRDFTVILDSIMRLGYSLEWRVINASDYGVPQSRKRLFIFGSRDHSIWNDENWFVLDRAFPGNSIFDGFIYPPENPLYADQFRMFYTNCGRVRDGLIESYRFTPSKTETMSIGDVLLPLSDAFDEVPQCIIPSSKMNFDSPEPGTWNYAKAKTRNRKKQSVKFPDDKDKPARTIITKSGETYPYREIIAISQPVGDFVIPNDRVGKFQPMDFGSGPEVMRTLTPTEIERVMTFPDGWTDNSGKGQIPRYHRGFVMGNSCPPLELLKIRQAIESLTA